MKAGETSRQSRTLDRPSTSRSQHRFNSRFNSLVNPNLELERSGGGGGDGDGAFLKLSGRGSTLRSSSSSLEMILGPLLTSTRTRL